MIETDALF